MKGAAMPKKLKDLSKTEWFLMNICWKLGKVPARNVYDIAIKKKDWQYQTAKTILDRLVKLSCGSLYQLANCIRVIYVRI